MFSFNIPLAKKLFSLGKIIFSHGKELILACSLMLNHMSAHISCLEISGVLGQNR